MENEPDKWEVQTWIIPGEPVWRRRRRKMENEPDKWEVQTWIIPGEPALCRRGQEWYIEALQGTLTIPVRAEYAEQIASAIASYQEWETRKYRRSLAFRWQRFWYLRKHPQSIKL